MMMDSGYEASFPVIFFDGDSTVDMGNVFIDPSLDFKSFRSIVSTKIGVSPHQITIYFERGPVPAPPPFGKVGGGGRRIPVTSKFNFASVLREHSCFFFVVSKRSRRVRRRKNKQSTASQSVGGLNYPLVAEIISPGMFDLAGRHSNMPFTGSNFSPPVKGNWLRGVDYLDYANQMKRALEVEKERYLMTLNLNSNVYSDLDCLSKVNKRSYGVSGSEITSEDGASSFGGVSGATLTCDVCTSAKMEGQTAPFHWCKCDAVVPTVFRSPAGPIARPSRSRVDPSGV